MLFRVHKQPQGKAQRYHQGQLEAQGTFHRHLVEAADGPGLIGGFLLFGYLLPLVTCHGGPQERRLATRHGTGLPAHEHHPYLICLSARFPHMVEHAYYSASDPRSRWPMPARSTAPSKRPRAPGFPCNLGKVSQPPQGLPALARQEAMGLRGLWSEGLPRMRQIKLSQRLKLLRLEERTWSCSFIL